MMTPQKRLSPCMHGFAALLAACSLAGAGSAQTAEPAALPPELNVVPRDAFVFVSARVGDLWNSDALKTLRLFIPPRELKLLREFEQSLGLKLSEFERVSLVLLTSDSSTHGPLLIATVAKPYERSKVVNVLTGGAPEEKLKGSSFYRLPKTIPLGALHLLNERTVILGEVRHVASLLAQSEKRPDAGPLLDALRLATQKHHVVVGINGAHLRENVPANMPFEAVPLLPLMAMNHAVVTVEVTDSVQAAMRVHFRGENQAKAGAVAVRDLLALARDGLRYGVKEYLREAEKVPRFQEALRRVDAWLAGIPVQLRETTVVVTLNVKKEEIPYFLGVLLPAAQKVREVATTSQGR